MADKTLVARPESRFYRLNQGKSKFELQHCGVRPINNIGLRHRSLTGPRQSGLVRMGKTMRQLALNKGTEKFIFRYESGDEDGLLDALIEQAKDKHTDFDWFDAAVLSFKLTQSLIGEADELLRESDPACSNSHVGD